MTPIASLMASMRRPVGVNKNRLLCLPGDRARGLALLRGEPPAFGGLGGTLPPRLFPGKRGKGELWFACCRRLFRSAACLIRHRQLALLPFALG